MIQRDDGILASTLRLQNDPDFERFLSWLEELRAFETSRLLYQGEGFSLTQAQGRLQMVTEILRAIESTRDVMEKLKGRSVNVTTR